MSEPLHFALCRRINRVMSIQARIRSLVEANDVVLFMKGERRAPRCGFSANTASILDEYLEDYLTLDVLSDEALREGIKEFSSWPTIPQLYVRGEFIGGADIVRELHDGDELAGILGVEDVPLPDPQVALSPSAMDAFRRFHSGDGPPTIRLTITSNFEYAMDFEEPRPRDIVLSFGDLRLVLDRFSASRADGLAIEFVSSGDEEGFKIHNPNEPKGIAQLPPDAFQELLKTTESIELVDVRTEEERAIAKIEGSFLLDEDEMERLAALHKDTPLAFYCHHGVRSEKAARHFLRLGFTRVYNLMGGIDAWSVEVDPSIPRY